MRILAFGAHLDDIEPSLRGTLARAVDNGHAVKMIVLSNSAYVNHDGTLLRTEDQAVEEGRRAAGILGVTDLEVLDFPNKDIPYSSRVVEGLDRKICEFKPDVIFTHWPFDTHQDHRNTGLSSISASRYYNTILMYEPITPAGRSYVGFRPQLYVDIGATLDRKIEALRAHKSQLEKYGEGWIEAVKARARYRGFDMGKEYAETFEVMRLEMTF